MIACSRRNYGGDQSLRDGGGIFVQFDLLNRINHCLGPEAVLGGYFAHLVRDGVIEGMQLKVDAERDGDKSGEGDECYVHLRALPCCSTDHVRLERDFGAVVLGESIKFLDSKARSDFVSFNDNDGGSATLIKKIPHDSYENPINLDWRGLVEEADLFFLGDK